jgi:hypothetical protein
MVNNDHWKAPELISPCQRSPTIIDLLALEAEFYPFGGIMFLFLLTKLIKR